MKRIFLALFLLMLTSFQLSYAASTPSDDETANYRVNISAEDKKKVFFDNFNNILRKAGNNVN